MAFAGDLTLVEVRDNWLKADGTAESGTITFQPSRKVVRLADGQEIAPTPVAKKLDGQGQLSVMLPATDDPDYTPTGWTYSVVVQLDGYTTNYSISVPLAAAGTGVDLGLLAPVDSSGGVLAPYVPSDALLLGI